jgi:tetratricopeptide (TPR) repeat protein
MSDRATRRPDGPPVSAAGRRRTRVRVIVGLFVVAVVASALIGWQFARESTPVTGPIVLISIDPLRADRLGVPPSGVSITPHLDRLASGATVFTQARSHAAASLPAHASLLTGQLPFDHGVRDNVGFTLDEDAETLAARLADRGFTTAAAVSTFLLRAETGLGAGFAHYDADRPTATADGPLPVVLRGSDATGKAATTWLDAQDSARFFYALQLNGDVPPVPGAGAGAGAVVGDVADAAAPDADAALAAADAAVGAVLETLRRKGWYDDALVVVTSAHGGSSGGDDPGRGYTLAAPATHVPLLVKMPGAAEPQRVDVPLQHIDLTPTLLDLVRAPGSSALRGRSFRAVLEGDADELAAAPAYAEAMSGALRFAWAELAEPADGTFRSSVAAVTPAAVSDADRHAFAWLGEVVPVIPPVRDPVAERPDPRLMGPVLAAYRLASWLDARQNFAAAIAAYRQVAAIAADDVDARFRLAQAAARLGRVEEAVAAFDAVIAARPALVDATIAAAAVEIDAGLLDKASARLAAALDAPAPLEPAGARATAHHLLATIAAARKRPEDARSQAMLAEQARPDVPYRQFLEGRLLHDQDRCEPALAAFDAAVTALATPPSPLPGLHWLRGDCLARLDRHPEALAAFERAIAEAPFDLRAYTSLATLLDAANRHDDAAAVVERMVRTVPTPAAYATAVRLSTVLGNRDRAAQLRAEARERFAGEPAPRQLPR